MRQVKACRPRNPRKSDCQSLVNNVLPKRAIRTRYFLPTISGDRSGMKYNSNLISGSCGENGGSLANVRSVHRDNRVNCAYLKVWEGQAKLNVNRNSKNANPNYGSLCLRRKFQHPVIPRFLSRYYVKRIFSIHRAFALFFEVILAMSDICVR